YADDVHRLLRSVTAEKADVFASSGGAVVAFELVVRHPEQLRTVVFHEPPTPAFQAQPAAVRAAMEHVCDTCAADGLWPAMQEFMALVGVQGGPPPAQQGEPTPEQHEAMAMMQRNMEFFFGRYIRNIARYDVDVEGLKRSSCTLVPAIGSE